MVWYEIILSVVAIASLLLIGWRFLSKFSLAARVDLENLPEEKQQVAKKKILDERLRRRLKDQTVNLRKKVVPFFKAMAGIIGNWYQMVLEKEKQLKISRLQEKSNTPEGLNLLADRANSVLIEAQSLFRQDDFSGAEKKYLEVISFDTKNTEAFEGLGDIYLKQKKYQEAGETYKYLLKLTHAEAYYYDKLGQVAKAQGNLQEAEAQLTKSVSLSSQNAGYLFDLAEVFKLEEDWEQAAENLVKALEIEPNNPKYLDALLEISIIRKDKFIATDILIRLEKVNPDNNKLPTFREQVENL